MQMSDPTRLFFLGALMIVVPIVLAIPYFKWCIEIERDQFERTNAHGVKEYASYEDMRRDVNREARAKGTGMVLIVPGLISIALGALMMFASFHIR